METGYKGAKRMGYHDMYIQHNMYHVHVHVTISCHIVLVNSMKLIDIPCGSQQYSNKTISICCMT